MQIINKTKDLIIKKPLLFSTLSLILFFTLILLFDNGVYSYYSDDFLQYRPFLEKTINNIKSGNFDLYNIYDNYGTDIFALAYYVPIDIFSFLIFILSYLMPFDFAFEIIEVSKYILGFIVFYKFLELKNFKTKTKLILSFSLLVCGGFTAYYNFPTYSSLIFYVPLTLIILEVTKDKKYVFAFYAFILFLYNFYNAYLIIINVFLAKEIISLYKTDKIDKEYFLSRIKEISPYILYTLIGLLLSSIVVFPSVLYILNESSINRGDFIYFFSFEHFKVIISTILIPFSAVDFLAANSYIEAQASLFIGLPLLILLSIFLFDSYKRKRKILISFILLILLIVPIFSMFLNGTGFYSRWYFMLDLILLFFASEVLEKEVKLKLNIYFFIFILIISMFIVYMDTIKNDILINLSSTQSLYLAIILLLSILLMIKKENIKKYFNKIVIFSLSITLLFVYTQPTNNVHCLEIKKDAYQLENVLNDLNINNIDRILYENAVWKYENYNFYTNKNIDQGMYFASFVNKNNKDFYKAVSPLFNEDNWYFNKDNFNILNACITNQKYFVIKKSENLTYKFEDKIAKKIYEDENYIIYENLYAFEALINYTKNDLLYDNNNDNLINMLSNLTFLNNNQIISGEHNEIVGTFYISKEEIKEKKINNITYSVINLNIPYDNNYFYMISNYDQQFSQSINSNTSLFGTMLTWKDNNLELRVTKKDMKIEISRISKQVVFEALENQKQQNDIKVTYNNDTFNIQGSKKIGEKAYLTIPYTYNENFVCEYEIIKGNGGFTTIVLPENIDSFNFDINYEYNFTPYIFSTIIGAVTISIIIFLNKRKSKKIN